jgi:hypothetical protein
MTEILNEDLNVVAIALSAAEETTVAADPARNVRLVIVGMSSCQMFSKTIMNCSLVLHVWPSTTFCGRPCYSESGIILFELRTKLPPNPIDLSREFPILFNREDGGHRIGTYFVFSPHKFGCENRHAEYTKAIDVFIKFAECKPAAERGEVRARGVRSLYRPYPLFEPAA